MHPRNVPPDAGLAGLRLVDDLDADTLALELVADAKAAVTAADDDHVVIDAGSCADPARGIASAPAQRAGGLRLELLARRGGRLGRRGAGLRQRGGRAHAADGKRGRAAEEATAVDSTRGGVRGRVLGGIRRLAIVVHAVLPLVGEFCSEIRLGDAIMSSIVGAHNRDGGAAGDGGRGYRPGIRRSSTLWLRAAIPFHWPAVAA